MCTNGLEFSKTNISTKYWSMAASYWHLLNAFYNTETSDVFCGLGYHFPMYLCVVIYHFPVYLCVVIYHFLMYVCVVIYHFPMYLCVVIYHFLMYLCVVVVSPYKWKYFIQQLAVKSIYKADYKQQMCVHLYRLFRHMEFVRLFQEDVLKF